MVKLRAFLGRFRGPLLRTELPLIKNTPKPLGLGFDPIRINSSSISSRYINTLKYLKIGGISVVLSKVKNIKDFK